MVFPGVLPVEEAVYFLMTNVLIAPGMTLMQVYESCEHMPLCLRRRFDRNFPSNVARD